MGSPSASNPGSSPASPTSLPFFYAVRSDRERLLEAMVRSAAAKGYEATTVADVVVVADLPRETFEAMFAGKEACFLEAYDAAVDVLVAHVTAAYQATAGERWPDRIAAALRALAELFAAEADIARMAVVEVTAVGEDARLHLRDALDRFTPFLEEGRAFASRAEDLPADTASFAIGGATAMIFDEVRAGRTAELPGMVPDLAFAVLTPYLGPAQAEAEMRRLRGGG